MTGLSLYELGTYNLGRKIKVKLQTFLKRKSVSSKIEASQFPGVFCRRVYTKTQRANEVVSTLKRHYPRHWFDVGNGWKRKLYRVTSTTFKQRRGHKQRWLMFVKPRRYNVDWSTSKQCLSSQGGTTSVLRCRRRNLFSIKIEPWKNVTRLLGSNHNNFPQLSFFLENKDLNAVLDCKMERF